MVKESIFILINIISCLTIFAQPKFDKKYLLEIDTIKVYYLSWNYNAVRRISENDVRDFYGKNSYYCTTKKEEINEFKESLNIFYFEEVEMHAGSIYMVIDFILSNGGKKTILFHKSKVCLINNNLYVNIKLLKLIDKYIPKTNAPN